MLVFSLACFTPSQAPTGATLNTWLNALVLPAHNGCGHVRLQLDDATAKYYGVRTTGGPSGDIANCDGQLAANLISAKPLAEFIIKKYFRCAVCSNDITFAFCTSLQHLILPPEPQRLCNLSDTLRLVLVVRCCVLSCQLLPICLLDFTTTAINTHTHNAAVGGGPPTLDQRSATGVRLRLMVCWLVLCLARL